MPPKYYAKNLTKWSSTCSSTSAPNNRLLVSPLFALSRIRAQYRSLFPRNFFYTVTLNCNGLTAFLWRQTNLASSSVSGSHAIEILSLTEVPVRHG
jgi:hypothetical protein